MADRRSDASPSLRLRCLNLALRYLERPALATLRSPVMARRRARIATQFLGPISRKSVTQSAKVAGVRCLRCYVPDTDIKGTFLYLHGGGYVLGAPETHRALAVAFAETAGLEAVLPAYRLAPENPYPAALEDALAVYHALRVEGPVFLAGDSAGGGLALALLHCLLRGGAALPEAVLTFSPWVDLSCSAESYERNAETEVMLPPEKVKEIAASYLDGADPTDPGASPLHGSFAGAPPVLIQASPEEIFWDDCVSMAETLRQAGVDVTFEHYPNTPHVVALFSGWVPEADDALRAASEFLRRAIS